MDTDTPTPRTDALFKQFGPVLHPAVMAYHSALAKTERELAEARKDKGRLDWLSNYGSVGIWAGFYSGSHPQSGQPVTEISELGDAESLLGGEISSAPCLRAAIDAAMEESGK